MSWLCDKKMFINLSSIEITYRIFNGKVSDFLKTIEPGQLECKDTNPNRMLVGLLLEGIDT
jgi:hypothetical protein